MTNMNYDGGTMSATTDPLETVTRILGQIVGRLDALEGKTKPPEKARRRKAKGTEEVIPSLPPSKPRMTLAERIENMIKARGPVAPERMSRDLGVAINHVVDELKKMRPRISDVGIEGHPRFVWKLGEGAAVADVKHAIVQLIQDQPFSNLDLCLALGFRPGDKRVDNALVDIRRDVPAGKYPGFRLHNLGEPRRARYFLVPTDAPDAALESKSGSVKAKRVKNK